MADYTLPVSGRAAVATWRALSEFERGYLTAAMWTLTDADGQPRDDLGLADITPEAVAAARVDCASFVAACRADLDAVTAADAYAHGADFLLTRNRHGAGFWGRGYPPDVAARLTAAAQAYGETNWYVDDAGIVRAD